MAPKRGDDSGCDGLTDVEGIAYGKNSLADLELDASPKTAAVSPSAFTCKSARSVSTSLPRSLASNCTAVGQCYAQIGDAVNHVVICQNVPMLGDNNAAAQCFHVRLGIAVPVDADCIG